MLIRIQHNACFLSQARCAVHNTQNLYIGLTVWTQYIFCGIWLGYFYITFSFLCQHDELVSCIFMLPHLFVPRGVVISNLYFGKFHSNKPSLFGEVKLNKNAVLDLARKLAFFCCISFLIC